MKMSANLSFPSQVENPSKDAPKRGCLFSPLLFFVYIIEAAHSCLCPDWLRVRPVREEIVILF